jgi:hypothetical protein
MRIRDLLDRDFSRPIEDLVKVNNDDPDTVFTELTEYVATDAIRAEYERLFSALAAAPKSPSEDVGVWISGFFGSGKSSFVKNLGYVLANREVLRASASSLFLKQVASKRVSECVEFLNRAVPYEVFMCDVQVEIPAQTTVETKVEQIAEVMYKVLLRALDYAEDYDISELEIELEQEGKLAAFQDLCRAEYNNAWREIRKGSQRLARASAQLHRIDPRTYGSTDSWLNMVKARPPLTLSVKDWVKKMFDLCEIRLPGKTFAFIVDEIGQYVERGGERIGNVCAVAEHFGKESLVRQKAGKIPGPAWIIVAAEERAHDIDNYFAAIRMDLPQLQDHFKHKVDLYNAGIREVVSRGVLRKKESQESILRRLFRDHGASLIHNVKLERSSRRTEFDEEQFVQFYPYLPHLIDLSMDSLAGVRQHPQAPRYLGGGNRTVVKQSFEMIMSDRTRFGDQPVGILVSLDKIYELVEGNLPPSKQKDILAIRERFDGDQDYPGMAARVAKAICLMDFAKTDLPRTTRNIAALLIQRVTEAPPVLPVASMLHHMRAARFVRETENGWKLYDSDELRRAAVALEGLRNAMGTINPRLPGWHNDVIQLVKKLLARALTWQTRPLHEFNAAVSRSMEEIIWSLDHISANMVAPDRVSANAAALDSISMDMLAFERRLAQSENRTAAQVESMQEQLDLLREQVQAFVCLQKTAIVCAPAGEVETDWDQRARENHRFHVDTRLGNDRTAYVIGLFGTGRRYLNDVMLEHIGERAKYFRDTIRLHPGPTPMIYSGHATMRHASRAQESPAVMRRILEAVRLEFADLIFIYRHPIDSLLTNWVWWRTYMRDNWAIAGISQIHKNTDDLCADLEENFSDFKTFAEGDPVFFAAAPGPRFLSFDEFVEETELHRQAAKLTLRLEDFMIDPLKQFSKIVEVMSVDLDLSRLRIAPPRTKPYRYLGVMEKVPRFKDFIDGLNAETKDRIETIGYNLGD